MNKEKIILDLCGGTGSWSKPYKDAGYTVYNLTIPEYDVVDHVKGPDVIRFFRRDASDLEIPVGSIYGILAAPPCTMFSLARAGAKTPRDFVVAMRVVHACMDLIWHCKTYGNLKWWALENPVGLTRQFLGRPNYTFQPWEFGDESKKRTDLWGYFNEPTKKRGAKSPDYPRKGPGSWANQSKKKRSITPEAFALAFKKANL